MISLIKFTNELVISREEATHLGVKYEEIIDKRIGYKDDTLRVLDSSYYLILGEDCFPDENKPGYYVDASGEPACTYYVHTPIREKDKEVDFVRIPHITHMVDLCKFATDCRYKFTIEKSIVTNDTPVNNIMGVLDTVEQKLSLLDSAIDKATNFNFNSKCNVHLGGGLIVTYNEVLLLEDSCSDRLQVELNNGWRVIAVCVQANQRRPDYVLGRYNPNLDTTTATKAKR